MKSCKIIDIPGFKDTRGGLSILEEGEALSFAPKRAFFIYDVPPNESRGNHANLNTKFVMVALKGSVEIEVEDSATRQTFILDNPSTGLFLDSGTWKTMKNFTKDAVLLVIASTKYDKTEYITDYAKFKKEFNKQ